MEKSWIKYALVFIGFCFVFVILKCKTNSPQTVSSELKTEEALVTNNLPSSFLDFYERFHNEETYQMDHIVFPLDGQEQDTLTMEVVHKKWEKENWIAHKPFNSYGGTFTRDYTNLDGIIIEYITDSSKTFSMQRRYSQIAGEWHLIFYSTFEMKPE